MIWFGSSSLFLFPLSPPLSLSLSRAGPVDQIQRTELKTDDQIFDQRTEKAKNHKTIAVLSLILGASLKSSDNYWPEPDSVRVL